MDKGVLPASTKGVFFFLFLFLFVCLFVFFFLASRLLFLHSMSARSQNRLFGKLDSKLLFWNKFWMSAFYQFSKKGIFLWTQDRCTILVLTGNVIKSVGFSCTGKLLSEGSVSSLSDYSRTRSLVRQCKRKWLGRTLLRGRLIVPRLTQRNFSNAHRSSVSVFLLRKDDLIVILDHSLLCVVIRRGYQTAVSFWSGLAGFLASTPDIRFLWPDSCGKHHGIYFFEKEKKYRQRFEAAVEMSRLIKATRKDKDAFFRACGATLNVGVLLMWQ